MNGRCSQRWRCVVHSSTWMAMGRTVHHTPKQTCVQSRRFHCALHNPRGRVVYDLPANFAFCRPRGHSIARAPLPHLTRRHLTAEVMPHGSTDVSPIHPSCKRVKAKEHRKRRGALRKLRSGVLPPDRYLGARRPYCRAPHHLAAEWTTGNGARRRRVVRRHGSHPHELLYLRKSPGCVSTIRHGWPILPRHPCRLQNIALYKDHP